MIGTSIFLAGGEASGLIKSLIEGGVRNILFSYFYIWELRRENAIARIQRENPHVNWFLDSGAFTYMVRRTKEPDSLPPLDQYVRRYFAYIDEYGAPYCRVTELDVDTSGHPLEEVDEWREEMLERWPHLNVTPVWHETRGIEAWDQYCEDPRIRTLAIGSEAGDATLGRLRQLVNQARKWHKPVHGFGQTKTKVLRTVPFDSVDSSSWSFGQRSGITFIFRANTFLVMTADKKNLRRVYRRYFKNIGCDAQKVIDDDVKEVRKANVIAWRAYSDRLEWLKANSGQTEGLHPDYWVRSIPVPGHYRINSTWRQPAYGPDRVSDTDHPSPRPAAETQPGPIPREPGPSAGLVALPRDSERATTPKQR